MSFDSSQLDYIPGSLYRWATENSVLLELIVEGLIADGHWPSIKKLTRRLAREGRPVPVGDVLSQMPRPLGYVDFQSDQPILFLFALRMTRAGSPLLDGFTKVLRLAVERYQGNDDTPIIHRADIVGGNAAYKRALGDVLLREAPFLNGGPGLVDDDWARDVTEAVIRYWDVATPDDYLRRRAGELARNPQLGWRSEPIVAKLVYDEASSELVEEPEGSAIRQPLNSGTNERDAFISHAGEDLAIAEELARALQGSGWSVWLDSLELTVGDSLNGRLNEALAKSRFGVVILSEAFFNKHWPKQELNAMAAKEAASGSKVILPVWHGIDHAYLAEVAPMLADRIGVSTDSGLPHVAAELIRALERARHTPYEPGRTGPLVQSVTAPPSPSRSEDQSELLQTIDALIEQLSDHRGNLRGDHARLYGAVMASVKTARPDNVFVSALSTPRETAMRGIFETTAAEALTGLNIMRSALLSAA